MKRRIILSVAVVLSVGLLLLTTSDSTAQAQRNRFYIYDPGIITLGGNQKLQVTVSTNAAADIVFHEYGHGLSACNGNVCKYSQIQDNQVPSINLAIGEGASDTVAFSAGVTGTRITVTSNNPNLRVNWQIIDTVTGAVAYLWTGAGPNAY
jgi:hypothetical protein